MERKINLKLPGQLALFNFRIKDDEELIDKMYLFINDEGLEIERRELESWFTVNKPLLVGKIPNKVFLCLTLRKDNNSTVQVVWDGIDDDRFEDGDGDVEYSPRLAVTYFLNECYVNLRRACVLQVVEDRFLRVPSNRIRFSLSATNQHRYEQIFSGRDCFYRSYDAVYDIEIIDSNSSIRDIHLTFNELMLRSEKINGKWSIEKWFTREKPLFVMCLAFMVEKIHLLNEGRDCSGIEIRWKTERYSTEKYRKLLSESFSVNHGDFTLNYGSGYCYYKNEYC